MMLSLVRGLSGLISAFCRRGSRPRGLAAGMVLPVTAALVGGCNGLDPVATTYQPDPAQLYFALTIDHPAVNLSTVAPYDTFRLTATPRNVLGEPMTELPAPTFRLDVGTDSTYVTLMPDGFVEVRTATGGQGIRVIAELNAGGIRHTDLAVIKVIADPPPQVVSLAVDPLPPDSARFSMTFLDLPDENIGSFYFARFPYRFGRATFPKARASDVTGNPVTGLMIEYTTLDPTIAAPTSSGNQSHISAATNFFSSYLLPFGWRPGHTQLVARTIAYGDTLADTTDVTVTWPLLQWVQAVPVLDGTAQFVPSEIRLAPYGVVGWQNRMGDAVDVTFDDPSHVADPALAAFPLPDICDELVADLTYGAPPLEQPFCGPGNAIMPAPPLYSPDSPGSFNFDYTIKLRQFPVPGVYTYHSVRTGATGQVIVTNDTDPAPTALP